MAASPNIDELVEARERVDAGLRLAFPCLFDRTPDPEPEPAPIELDGETVNAIGRDLDAATASAIAAGAKLPLDDELQRRFNAVVNELFDIATVLGERRGS